MSALTDRWDNLIIRLAARHGPPAAGSFLSGVLVGIRLERASHKAASEVLVRAESNVSRTEDVVPEQVEGLVRNIVGHTVGQ